MLGTWDIKVYGFEGVGSFWIFILCRYQRKYLCSLETCVISLPAVFGVEFHFDILYLYFFVFFVFYVLYFICCFCKLACLIWTFSGCFWCTSLICLACLEALESLHFCLCCSSSSFFLFNFFNLNIMYSLHLLQKHEAYLGNYCM